MNKYEMLFIISPSISDEEKDALINRFKEQIEKSAGTVEGVDKWGIKKLAYPIKFKNEGFYVLVNFTAKAEVANAIEKLMLITDNILRCMIIRK